MAGSEHSPLGSLRLSEAIGAMVVHRLIAPQTVATGHRCRRSEAHVGGDGVAVMWEASTPDGKIHWKFAPLPGLFAPTKIMLALYEIVDTGLEGPQGCAPATIESENPSDVRAVLVTLYGADIKFSDTAPPAAESFPPAEPGAVY